MQVGRVRDALGRGDYLAAHDLALASLEACPGDPELRYLAVLALARAGATEQAARRYHDLGLDAIDLGRLDASFAEDLVALAARLAKDRALEGAARDRRVACADAAARYEAVFERFRRPYACINAATMWLLAGEPGRAEELALEARRLLRDATPPAPDDAYWRAATEAEAALLLGDLSAASEFLRSAAACSDDDAAKRATTRRQLARICAALGIGTEILAPLANKKIIHYCGHMVGPPARGARLATADEESVTQEIDRYLDAESVGAGFGSLACGADIIVAEALLARGAELHVTLPFATDEFVAVSVARGGEPWVNRFHACLAAATSVSWATTGEYLDSPELFAYCSRLAMGAAVMRSRFVEAPVEQLAVWDGRPGSGPAGTAADIARWQAAGHRTHVVDCAPDAAGVSMRTVPSRIPPRSLRALLFADVKGYSKLRDAEISVFVEQVLRSFGAVLDRAGSHVLSRNTWGDGLYVVFDDVASAAVAALGLQDAMQAIDLEAAALPSFLALRVGVHAGPVFEALDPIVGSPGYFGTEVTRTARIEPRTPEGDVYTTDAFAALLALDRDEHLWCQYVGRVPAAKDFGTIPMYLLRSRPPQAE